jgi:lipopolysaccharide/colanic/teichoic acid biosynthesis glycosyltransferase
MVIQAIVGAETRVRSGITLRHCVAVTSSTAAPSADATMNAELVRPAVGDAPRGWDRSAVPRTSDRRRRVHFAIKRLMDIVISAVMLMLLLPLFAVIAVVIKLTSKGPIFFMHKRELREGREFSCVKFRTMVQGAHAMQSELLAKNEVDGPQFKIRDDPRVTRIGDWLRNTNVDELPQLFNVLVGHMSLVGPRPSPFRENQICVPWRRARLSVRPGITGLWQICRSADRSGGDFHEWIFYDIAYVRHFSIWLDLKIMAATILTRGGRWSLPLSRLIGEAKARAPFAERSVA